MTIHLLRHGKTVANENRLYCGRTDLPLSEAGAREIGLLGGEEIYPEADVLFSSGMLRADQTLEIIYGNRERIVVPELVECDFGDFEMKSYEELKEQPDYRRWISDETGSVPCPGGESKNRVWERVLRGFNQVLEEARRQGAESAVVACHGGTIVCIMEHLLPNQKNFYEWQPQPGRGYSLLYAGEGHIAYKTI